MADGAIEWTQAVGWLTAEKERAESDVSRLKAHAAGNAVAMAEGRRLYSDAKAEFDQIIAQILTAFAVHRNVEPAPALTGALQSAVARRRAFAGHVAGFMPVREGEKGLDALGLGEVAKFFNGLVQLVISGREGRESRRKAIETQVAAARWRSFDDIKPA